MIFECTRAHLECIEPKRGEIQADDHTASSLHQWKHAALLLFGSTCVNCICLVCNVPCTYICAFSTIIPADKTFISAIQLLFINFDLSRQLKSMSTTHLIFEFVLFSQMNHFVSTEHFSVQFLARSDP